MSSAAVPKILLILINRNLIESLGLLLLSVFRIQIRVVFDSESFIYSTLRKSNKV
jgi:hypothetical protein